MKTKNPFLLPALIAALNLIPAGRATAQTFTILRSFGILTNITGWNPQFQLVQGLDGTLYGTTSRGEGNVAGTVFKLQPDGSAFTVLKWFTNSVEGANPSASLTLSGGVLYGTTSYGGTSGHGTVFKVNTDGTGYTVLRNFIGGDGRSPMGLTLAGSTLYGTTLSGGSSDFGTVFRVNTDGTGYTVLKSLTASEGGWPSAGVTLSGSVLYGTTTYGANFGGGTVFKINTDGTEYTTLKYFTFFGDGQPSSLTLSGGALYGTTHAGLGTVFRVDTDGAGYAVLKNFSGSDEAHPNAGLTLSGSTLYGTTASGGSLGQGTVFKVDTDGTGYTVLKNFAGQPGDGSAPVGGLTLSGSTLYGTTFDGGSLGQGMVFKVHTDGTGYSGLMNFTNSDAASPLSSLVLVGNVLYGTTSSGGTFGNGTVFKINTNGTSYKVLKDFGPAGREPSTSAYTNTDGAWPSAGLTLSDNVLYGTTPAGGSSGNGTVFKVNADGTGYTVLKTFGPAGRDPSTSAFTNTDGAWPRAGLTLSRSVLYGTTHQGGSFGNGTVFKVNTDGSGYMVLKHFGTMWSNANSDGAWPYASLTLSGNVLYGTTGFGGNSGMGTVFKLNIDGTGYTALKHFTSSEGAYSHAGLAVSEGVIYGTTEGGGGRAGTVFQMNTDGTGYTVLKIFTGNDGLDPETGLTLSGGVLYGTTHRGGNSGYGTVFQLNTDGTRFRVLKNLTGSDGVGPLASLTLSDGVLYGTTVAGGSLNLGTVFSLSLPPPPLARCKHVTVTSDVSCSANASIDDGSFSPNPGDAITLVQSPPGPYPPGDTSVTLTVIDSYGASNSCVAAVTVVDSTTPVITCPPSIVTHATSTAGTVVSFAPTASDNCSLISVTSSPASGSIFAIGDTTVSCTATDAVGNQAACSFTVHVKSAAEQINDLIALVQSLDLPAGTASSLIAKLQGAASALERGNIESVCGHLVSFLNETNAQKGKKLTVAQVGLLSAEARRIRAALGHS